LPKSTIFKNPIDPGTLAGIRFGSGVGILLSSVPPRSPRSQCWVCPRRFDPDWKGRSSAIQSSRHHLSTLRSGGWGVGWVGSKDMLHVGERARGRADGFYFHLRTYFRQPLKNILMLFFSGLFLGPAWMW
jgi:hypothetical protein